MHINDHLWSRYNYIIRATTWADRSLAVIPKIGDVSVGEKAVAVRTTAGRVRSFRVAVHILKHSIVTATGISKKKIDDLKAWSAFAPSLRGRSGEAQFMASFVKDVEDIRQRAMRKLEDGAVTDSYQLDKEQSVAIMNEALASEIVCVLRYQHHYFMASGVHGRSVAQTFKKHSDEEREHVEEIAERIQQLGGKPDFNPGSLVERSVSQYIEGESLGQMIREDLIAERIVIDVYQRFIEHFGIKDPTTRTLFEHIKGEEEKHADELSEMLFIVDPRTGADRGTAPEIDDATQNVALKPETQEEFELVEQALAAHREERLRLEGESDAPGKSIGGVGGRPMNRRNHPAESDDTEAADHANDGGMQGTNRSPKVLEKQRKNRAA
jgi:bacterioferritin